MKTQRQLLERLALIERIVRPTSVIKLQHEKLDLFVKLEFFNGVGSVKDRPAFEILKCAIERGAITPSTTIVESSSGNFATALACFSRMLGLDFIPVLDPNVSPFYEALLRAQCRQVVKVEQRDDTGGYLKTRLAAVQSLLEEFAESFWTNQYANIDAMEAHYRLTGAEIHEAMPDLDYVFLGVSSAGTIAGVSRYLKERNPRVRIIAVDVQGSVIFGNAPGKRYISGLGSSIRPPLLEHAIIDDVVHVSEVDTIAACNLLLQRHGLFAGGSTGTVFSAIGRHFEGISTVARPKILFLCCDRGSAYLHNVYDREWAAWRAAEERSG